MQAIVLSRRDFREHDQIVSVYTKERGKMELLARGLKKTVSKNAAHLEPFSVVFVEWVPGKQMSVLTSVVPLHYFPRIRTRLTSSLAAGFVMSFIDTLTQVDVSDVIMFKQVLSWLLYVEQSEDATLIGMDGVVLGILASLGVAPILNRCVVCGRAWEDIGKALVGHEGQPGFSPAAGGILCGPCRSAKASIGEEIFTVGFREVAGLQLYLKGDWRRIHEFPFEPEEIMVLHRVILAYARYHSERAITDWAVWFRL